MRINQRDSAYANVIDRAERAIRAFDATDRRTAERLLGMWAHADQLTAEQREAVLARFYVAEEDEDQPRGNPLLRALAEQSGGRLVEVAPGRWFESGLSL